MIDSTMLYGLDVLLAVMLDFLIGDPYWFPHPVIYIGKLISSLEKAGRKLCTSKEGIRIFGGIIVIAVAAVSFFIPYVILRLLKGMPLLFHAANILIIWTTIAAKCLHKEAIKVCDELKKGDLVEARVKLSYIVGRDTSALSEQEVIRADVETVAENTSDGVIAPLLFAMIGGAPFAMLYKGINTMDSMLGYLNEKYRYIGFFPAKVDDVANYIPARVTGILMCLTAPVVGGNIRDSLKIMIRDRKNHKSPNCAYPEAAAAGAMRVQLGGTNIYFGEVMEKPTIGDRIKELEAVHISQTIQLMYAAEVLALLTYFGILILWINRFH